MSIKSKINSIQKYNNVVIIFLIVIGGLSWALYVDTKDSVKEFKTQLAEKAENKQFNKEKLAFEQSIAVYYDQLLQKNHEKLYDDAVLIVGSFEKYEQLDYKDIRSLQKALKLKSNLKKVKKLPSSNITGNLTLYKELHKLEPKEQYYKDKIAYYQAKHDKFQREKELQKQSEIVLNKRRNNIKRQFSGWDGTHYSTERMLKNDMHDPDSYEHVETTWWEKSDHLIVRTTYRGKNAFGAKVKSSITVKVSIGGKILKIINQS